MIKNNIAYMQCYKYALCMAALCCSALTQARLLPDFTPLVEANSAAVVNISAVPKKIGANLPQELPVPDIPEDSPFQDFFRKFFEQMPERRGPSMQPSPLGSGFIISEDGYVITNHHVIANAEEVTVRLNDRREFTAQVIGEDKRSDIALLKIEGDDLAVAKLGSSANLKVGEWVFAIGSPFGFDYSVTQGIISTIGRSLPNENYVPFIQTDVAINPGNSGGPLFNLKGEVIGVNSQIYSRTGGFMGLSFAVPVDVVKDVYLQLKDKGYVTRGWLGVLIQDVTRELAESFDMKKIQGALVAKVLADSPAAAAGIEVGDVIIRYDGREVGSSSALPPLVGSSGINSKVPLQVIRRGENKTIEILIAELPEDKKMAKTTPARPRGSATNAMRIIVRELTDAQREELDLPEDGIVVEKVMQGPAREAGIRDGDVILMMNNVDIKNVAHFEKVLEDLPMNKSIPLLIQRRNAPTFLAFKLSADK